MRYREKRWNKLYKWVKLIREKRLQKEIEREKEKQKHTCGNKMYRETKKSYSHLHPWRLTKQTQRQTNTYIKVHRQTAI